MRKEIYFAMPAILMACAVFAETESIAGVLKELRSDQTETAASIGETETAVQEKGEAVTTGFIEDQKMLKKHVVMPPKSRIARMYPQMQIEGDHRRAEVGGMEEVDEAWSTELVMRSYTLSEQALEKLYLQNVQGTEDISSVFAGVDFPKKTSAVFDAESGILFSRNTRENLVVLEEILRFVGVAQLSPRVDQVEIETKFVEVSEGVLEELGFQWNFSDPTDVSVGGDDLGISDGVGLFSGALRASPSGSSPELPFSRSGSLLESEVSSDVTDWSASRFEDTFSEKPAFITLEQTGVEDPYQVLISALDQTTGADVLSAPRVTTKSGESATIRVGQLHSYPETYEVGGNEGNIVHVRYEKFKEKLLGVELEVKPKVEGDKIHLDLNPKIIELIGWQSYTVAPPDSSYTYYQYRLGMKYQHDAVVARLPIFRKREINTKVTIADGATIGMGGLINEKIEAFEDKIPVLGSLPLVGRLFRNEGERTVKRNLMMFVTAKKLEPTGRINTARSFE